VAARRFGKVAGRVHRRRAGGSARVLVRGLRAARVRWGVERWIVTRSGGSFGTTTRSSVKAPPMVTGRSSTFLSSEGPGPIRLDVVQTTRDPDFPWVFLVPESPDPDLPGPTRRILVPEQYVERIEIYLERVTHHVVAAERRPLGFSYEVIDDPSSDDE
jgi:hypothetical protein